MVFQEPMASLSLVHTIGNQIIEAIRLHENVGKARPANARSRCSAGSASRTRSAGWTRIRSSSAAACGSER